MDIQSLQRDLELPEIHRKILSGYAGPYSLGIGTDPQRLDVPILILEVEDANQQAFPSEVIVGGVPVHVVVRGGFKLPMPLTRRR